MIGLIIAAGKQKRFKFEKPKALCEVDGEVLAIHNYNILNKYCSKVFIIVSNTNKQYFREYFTEDQLFNIGKSGLGSGDAIYHALMNIKSDSIESYKSVIICWGDTVLDEDVVSKTVNNYETQIKINVCVPVVYEEKPYVQFTESGKVLFSKYGDNITSGYHDLSIFVGDISQLKLATESFRSKFFVGDKYNHKHGSEFEFLDIFNDTYIKYNLLPLQNVKDRSFNTVEELEQLNCN